MKRKIAVLLVFTLLLTSVGCSSGKKSSRNNRDDDDEIEETESSYETDDTGSSVPESSKETPAHTEKSEPETTASETSASSPASDREGDTATIADVIGTVDGKKYVSSYMGVEYTLGKDSSFGGREILQASYGAIDETAKLSEANMMIPIAGTYIIWPDGSNLSISYQVNPLFVESAMNTYLEANRSASETAIKNMGYEVDKSEVTTVKVGDKSYDAIIIDSQNSNGQKINQVMVMTYNNGVIVFATTTSIGKYTSDDMLKGLKLP